MGHSHLGGEASLSGHLFSARLRPLSNSLLYFKISDLVNLIRSLKASEYDP